MATGYRGNPPVPTGAVDMQQIAGNLYNTLHPLVAKLTGNAYSQIHMEIQKAIEHAPPQLRHTILIRVLLECIDFNDMSLCILHNNGAPIMSQHREYYRLQLLASEVKDLQPAELANALYGRFDSTISLPEAFLVSFCKNINLPYATQFVLLMLLGRCKDSRWVKDCFALLGYLLHPDVIQRVSESNIPEHIIIEQFQFIVSCPVAYLRLNVKLRYIRQLKAYFPSCVNNARVLELMKLIPKTDHVQQKLYNMPALSHLNMNMTATHVNANTPLRLVDLIWDGGYEAFDTVDKILQFYNLYKPPTEFDAALTLCVLLRTKYDLTPPNSVSIQQPAPVEFGAVAPLYTYMNADCYYGGTKVLHILPNSLFVPTHPSKKPTTWDLEAFVRVWVKCYKLNMLHVLRYLDQPEFFIPEMKIVEEFVHLWSFAVQISREVNIQLPTQFPCEIFLGVWNNRHGQLSILRKLIELPHTLVNFCAIPNLQPLKYIDDMIILPHTTGSKNMNAVQKITPETAITHQNVYHPWYCIPLVETLISLSDLLYLEIHQLSGKHGPNSNNPGNNNPNANSMSAITQGIALLLRKDAYYGLLNTAVNAIPEVIATVLATIRGKIASPPLEELFEVDGAKLSNKLHNNTFTYLTVTGYFVLEELLEELLFMFILPNPLHPNSRPVIVRMWKESAISLLTAMVRLHSIERASLPRILDIVQDIKEPPALSSVLEVKNYKFTLDLAVLAAKRQFLKLDSWIQSILRSNPLPFFIACIEYIKVNIVLTDPNSSSNSGSNAGANAPNNKLNPYLRRQQYNPLTLDSLIVIFKVLLNPEVQLMLINTPLPPGTHFNINDYINELHALYKYGCTIHPKLATLFAQRPDSNRERYRNEADHLCATLLCGEESNIAPKIHALATSHDLTDVQIYDEFLGTVEEEAVNIISFPEPQRNNMIKLFSVILSDGCASTYHLGKLFGIILDFLNSANINIIYFNFAYSVISLMGDALKKWPAIIYRISKIPDVIQKKGQFTRSLEHICKEISVANKNFAKSPEDFNLDPDFLRGIHDMSKKRQHQLLSNQPVYQLSNKVMEKLTVLFNRLTPKSLPDCIAELKGLLEPINYRSIISVIIKRSLSDANISRYMDLVLGLHIEPINELVVELILQQLPAIVFDERNANANAGGNAPATTNAATNSAERNMCKSLGTWLGTFTLARDKPILIKHFNVQAEFFRAYDANCGQKYCLFAVKLLLVLTNSTQQQQDPQHGGSTTKPSIFAPPNPWTMGILSLIKEFIESSNNAPSYLKFEVEALFSQLNIDYHAHPMSTTLTRIDQRPKFKVYNLIHPTSSSSSSVASIASAGGMNAYAPGVVAGGIGAGGVLTPTLASLLKYINQLVTPETSLVHQANATIVFPQCNLLTKYPVLRTLVIITLELSVRDVFAQLRDTIMYILNTNSKDLSAFLTGKEDHVLDHILQTEIARLTSIAIAQASQHISTEAFVRSGIMNITNILEPLHCDMHTIEEFVNLTIHQNLNALKSITDRVLSEQARQVFGDIINRHIQGHVNIANLQPAVQSALDAIKVAISQLHAQVMNTANHANLTVAQVLRMPDNPIAPLLTQRIPACVKHALSLTMHTNNEFVYKFIITTILSRLLDTETVSSTLCLDVFKTLLWSVNSGFSGLSRYLGQCMLIPAHSTNAEQLLNLSIIVPTFLRDKLLAPADVDLYIFHTIILLGKHKHFITTTNTNPNIARCDPRLDAWLQLVSNIITPTGNAQLPIISLNFLPNTAEALQQAKHAVQQAPVQYASLSQQLSDRFNTILVKARAHPTGMISPAMYLGSVGDVIDARNSTTLGGSGAGAVAGGMPNMSHPHGGAQDPSHPAIPAYSIQSILIEEGKLDAHSKSAFAYQYDRLLQCVEVRDTTLSILDAHISECQYTINYALAEDILSTWFHVYITGFASLGNNTAIYSAYADELFYNQTIWANRNSVNTAVASVIKCTVDLLNEKKVQVQNQPPPQPNASQRIDFTRLTPEQLTEGVAAWLLFIIQHVNTPMHMYSNTDTPQRGDALHIDAYCPPVLPKDNTGAAGKDGNKNNNNNDKSTNSTNSHILSKAAMSCRIKFLRDICLDFVELIRGHWAQAFNTLKQIQASKSGNSANTSGNNINSYIDSSLPTSPNDKYVNFFPANAYGRLLTALINGLSVPSTLPPVGNLVSHVPSHAFTRVPFLDLNDMDVLLCIHDVCRLTAPAKIPGFHLAFLSILSNRVLLPRFLVPQARFPLLQRYFLHLILDMFVFLHPYARSVVSPGASLANAGAAPEGHFPEAIRISYKSLVRFITLLYRDFPDILSESSNFLCDAKILPDACSHLTNIILSAKPKNSSIITPSMRLELHNDIFLQPKYIIDPLLSLSSHKYVQTAILAPVDEYLKQLTSLYVPPSPPQPPQPNNTGNAPVAPPQPQQQPMGYLLNPNAYPFPQEIIEAMSAKKWIRVLEPKVPEEHVTVRAQTLFSQLNCHIDSQLLLALLMYFVKGGMTKVLTPIQQQKQQNGNIPSGLHILVSIPNCHAEALIRLILALEPNARHLALTLMINQLRYLNSHSYFMYICIQLLLVTCNRLQRYDVCEILLSIILRRLVSNGPVPNLLSLLVIDFVRDSAYEFWALARMFQVEHVFKQIVHLLSVTSIGNGIPLPSLIMQQQAQAQAQQQQLQQQQQQGQPGSLGQPLPPPGSINAFPPYPPTST